MPNPKSTAQIAGHPIHPMLIPFPIAFFVSTFVADLIYWQTGSAAWATATVWLLGAGLIGMACAGGARAELVRGGWLDPPRLPPQPPPEAQPPRQVAPIIQPRPAPRPQPRPQPRPAEQAPPSDGSVRF